MMLLDRIEQTAASALLGLPPPLLRALSGGAPVAVDGHVLDPQVQAAIRLHDLRYPELDTLSPTAARAQFRRQAAMLAGPPRPMRQIRELSAPGPGGSIPIRLYTPPGATAPAPIVVFFHGGGCVVGDLDTHDPVCRLLAAGSRCRVASVDYRLAPEHPFPAGLEDAVAAYEWLAAHAGSLGGEPDTLAVAGDSMGATFAAHVARAVDTPYPPAFQLLLYPMTDATRSMPSHRTFAGGYLLTGALIAWFLDHYLPDPALATDPRVSPLRADDLGGAPPTLVVTAGFDPLRDEGRAYADRLERAGVRVRYRCYPSLVHGFVSAIGVIDAARRAMSECAGALREMMVRDG